MKCEEWAPIDGKWKRKIYDYVPVGMRKREVACPNCDELFLSIWKNRSNGWPKTCSKKCRFKYMSAIQRRELNSNWHGQEVTYYGLHCWIRRQLRKSGVCGLCGMKKPLDAANISGEYRRDLNDWECLCRQCHAWKDSFKRRIRKIVGINSIRQYSH